MPSSDNAMMSEWVLLDLAALKADTNTERRSLDKCPITSFKMMQKASQLKVCTSVNGAGFAVGSASFQSLDYRYLAVLFSDYYDIIEYEDEQKVKRKRFKRFGFGLGVTLEVRDVKADMKMSFGAFSAASALNFAKVKYHIDAYGIDDAKILEYLPSTAGDFTFDIYKKILGCIASIKKYIAENPDIAQLYAIDVLSPVPVSAGDGGTRSFYFGAREVRLGNTLKEALDRAKQNVVQEEDPRILQYMYHYFGVSDAFTKPTSTQQGKARDWIQGKFNHVDLNQSVEDVWVAIDSGRDRATGNVITLGLGDDYAFHALPDDWHQRSWAVYDDNTAVSVGSSTKLAVAAIADVSSDFDSTTFIRDIAIYWDIYDSTPHGKVIQTRYGIGTRLKVRVSNVEFGVDVSYAAVGAASDLGYANVEVELSGIGIDDKGILGDLPGPMDVSQTSLEAIEAAMMKVVKRISTAGTDLSQFKPQPFMIQVREPAKVDPTLPHQATTYAYVQITKRVCLRDALKEAVPLGLGHGEIRAAYKSVNLTDPAEKPSLEQRNQARSWLELES